MHNKLTHSVTFSCPPPPPLLLLLLLLLLLPLLLPLPYRHPTKGIWISNDVRAWERITREWATPSSLLPDAYAFVLPDEFNRDKGKCSLVRTRCFVCLFRTLISSEILAFGVKMERMKLNFFFDFLSGENMKCILGNCQIVWHCIWRLDRFSCLHTSR